MTWLRSDLDHASLGRGLVIRVPRVSLTYYRGDGTYAVSGPLGRPATGLTLDNALSWLQENGIPWPSDADLAWLADGGP